MRSIIVRQPNLLPTQLILILLFKGKKGDKDIIYMAMLDIALRYKKEGVRNDTAPFNDILSKLTSEIEDALK